MSDEERRRLEREARYDAGLAALLTCLRDGHESGPVFLADQWPAGFQSPRVRIAVCPRCGLAFWDRGEAAVRREARERQSTEEALRIARDALRREREAEEQRRRDIGGTFNPR